MRQSSDDVALYLREVRTTVRQVFLPELQSAFAQDAAGLVDRILAHMIVEAESADAVSEEFGRAFSDVLDATGTFDDLRRMAEELAAKPEAPEILTKIAEIERAYLDRVDALRVEVLVDRAVSQGRPGALTVTPEQVTAYLRRRLPRSPDVQVNHLALVPGGRSKETVLVSLDGTTEVPSRLILRKDRLVALLQTRSADEFDILRIVHAHGGVPVPRPYFAERGDHELGEGTFQLMECVPGSKAGEYFPDLAAPRAHEREIGLQIAAALANLHAIPLEHLRGTGLETASKPADRDTVAASVDTFVDRIAGLSGPPCATVPLAARWLSDHIDDVCSSPRTVLLQGDIGLHNMLVDGDKLTAMVDWETAAVGPPAREMAAVWNTATALLPWVDFVAAYKDAGGAEEDYDPKSIAFYRVLAALGGYMTSRMGGHMFRTGTKRDLLTAHSGLDSHFRCTRNLARALADAQEVS